MNSREEGPMDPERVRYLLAEADPVSFLDVFFDLLARPVELLLADPGLPPQAIQELARREGADLTSGQTGESDRTSSGTYRFPAGFGGDVPPARIFIPTGGTTGAPRFARHDWNTLEAAARGFAEAFPGPAHAVGLLPLWHVGGLMQAVRALVTGGRLQLADWNCVRSGEDRPNPDGFFLSLVPTQLNRLLDDPTAIAWLKGFRAVYLGGSSADDGMLDRARTEGIPLAPAYGMTETAAQVSVLRPEEFLAGRSGVGRALPHAAISIVDDDGRPVAADEVGRIQIAAKSICFGYAERSRKSSIPAACGQDERAQTVRIDPFLTSDLGRMDRQGFLTVMGRVDDVIISGGEKVWPGEVEAAIKAVGLAGDVTVFGRPDDRWGAVVCAVLTGGSFVDGDEARAKLRSVLPVYQIPRVWRKVERLPRNRMGKLDRSRLSEMIEPT